MGDRVVGLDCCLGALIERGRFVGVKVEGKGGLGSRW